ncbi:hypothetical protein [Streptomyces canus]|uniref:hypothetical protein n=1 Tax=Streptomyces canus TaxID=58343 RepID=UPI002E379F71|nr:hypothetical protein [Streptomyces canus]
MPTRRIQLPVAAPITDYAREAAVPLTAGTLVPPTAQIGSGLDTTDLTPPKGTHPSDLCFDFLPRAHH